MSERDELDERLARARIALDEAQEEFDMAAADRDAYGAAHPEPDPNDETGPPA